MRVSSSQIIHSIVEERRLTLCASSRTTTLLHLSSALLYSLSTISNNEQADEGLMKLRHARTRTDISRSLEIRDDDHDDETHGSVKSTIVNMPFLNLPSLGCLTTGC